MRLTLIAALSVGGLLAASTPLLAQDTGVTSQVGAKPYQDATKPGAQGTVPLSRTGSGPDSAATGTSESGAGGTGGAGGLLSNGTSDTAGTATGGTPGGVKAQSGGSGG